MKRKRRLGAKGFLVAIGVFALLILFFLGAFFLGEKREKVVLDRSFYFLVRSCDASTSAAVVGEVYAAGGAGVLDGEEVILACYFSKADARRVCSLMESRGEQVTVLCHTAESFFLRGKNAALAPLVQGNADTVLSCIELLYTAANDLERGGGQAEAKAAVEGVTTVLKGLEDANTQPLFSAWNRELFAARRQAPSLDGILFAKDIRAMQVVLTRSVIDMKDCF